MAQPRQDSPSTDLCACGCGTPIPNPARCPSGYVRGHILKKHVGVGRYGSSPLTHDEIRARILERTRKEATGCWIWQGFVDASGYGRLGIKVNASSIMAHRVSYEVFVGPIPKGMELDHVCEWPACVNPQHLEPVTPRTNKERQGAANLRWIFGGDRA